MAFVETERHGQIMIVRLNRPDRMNAMGSELRQGMAEAFSEFRTNGDLEVAIFTGSGRAFCAGEDMKESLEKGIVGSPDPELEDPFMKGTLEKPVIAAVNGFAMGGGFMMVERTDLRVAVPDAVFEMSEAKRWLLGGYDHGHVANLPYPVAMEMALGFRFTAQRFHEIGFVNRVVEGPAIDGALELAHKISANGPLAVRVSKQVIVESRGWTDAEMWAKQQEIVGPVMTSQDAREGAAAFAQKRAPNWTGK